MSTDRDLVVGTDIQVAWGEQDAFGHLNNVVYLRYFETVRMHYLQRIGVLRSHADRHIGVILASTTCDFKKPVNWPCQLHIRTGCTRVGITSFTLHYRITDAVNDVVAEGSSVQVMYDYTNARKVEVPPDIRQAIAHLQGG